MTDQELVIDENNFNQYFFDARVHRPKKNQVLVKYSAMAELVDGPMKKNIIDLCRKDKIHAATQVMRKLGGACERDSVRVLKEICMDLIKGFSDDEIEKKSYKYKLEMFYYAEKQYVPDDPHWSAITINNLDLFLDSNNSNNKMLVKSKIIDSENETKKN